MSQDAAHTAERPSDRTEDLWRPRFGLVLLFISATFIFVSAAPTERWAILVAVVLLSATVLATARTAGARSGVRISVIAAAMLLVVGALISLLAPSRDGGG